LSHTPTSKPSQKLELAISNASGFRKWLGFIIGCMNKSFPKRQFTFQFHFRPLEYKKQIRMMMMMKKMKMKPSQKLSYLALLFALLLKSILRQKKEELWKTQIFISPMPKII
jgi:hypothetical protein